MTKKRSRKAKNTARRNEPLHTALDLEKAVEGLGNAKVKHQKREPERN